MVARETFGADGVRGPLGALKHLEKEARECQEAVTNPEELREELADCLTLLLDASRRSKTTLRELLQEAHRKMKVNRARQWPAPTNDEPVEHIKPVRSALIYNEGETLYAVVDGDWSDFDGVVINTGLDPGQEAALFNMLYNKEGGRLFSPCSNQEFAAAIKQGAVLVKCGFYL